MRRTALVLRQTPIALLGALVLAACTSAPSAQPTGPTEPVASSSPSVQATEPSTPAATETPSSTATHHLSLDGIAFDYPADWAVNDAGWQATSELGLAVIGTMPWGPCDVADINCHYKLRLDPGQIDLEVSMTYLVEDICALGQDPDSTGSPMWVDGRPAVRTESATGQTDYYNSDEQQTWLIARPGSIRDAFSIDARYRAPGVETMRAQLDQLIASVRLAPPAPGTATEPDDCGDPFPPATD